MELSPEKAINNKTLYKTTQSDLFAANISLEVPKPKAVVVSNKSLFRENTLADERI